VVEEDKSIQTKVIRNMKRKNTNSGESSGNLVAVSVVFIIICICLLSFSPGYSVIQLGDESYFNSGNGASCSLGYIPADINMEQSWTSEEGHTLNIEAERIPEGHRIEISRDGTTLGVLTEEGDRLTHKAESGEEFTIAQITKDDKRKLVNSIQINNYN
jgi:hypothetical protein